jgi:hypothetical protein
MCGPDRPDSPKGILSDMPIVGNPFDRSLADPRADQELWACGSQTGRLAVWPGGERLRQPVG